MTRKYVWMATISNKESTEATVVGLYETEREAAAKVKLTDYGGYEGPVPADMYHVGQVIKAKDYPGN